MTLAGFLMAVLALLLAPGPTNTLMALAAAQRGIGATLRLIPAELGAYLAVVVPLSFLGADLLTAWPGLAVGLKLAAGAWVMWLAVKLWRLPRPDAASGIVTGRQVMVTTLLNPKALVVGLVLLPSVADGPDGEAIAIFGAAVVAVAMLWGCLGATMRGPLPFLQRAASLWLGAVSVSILAGALSA